MPIKTWIDNGIIFREQVGELSIDAIINSCGSLPDNPDFKKGMPFLWDFRKTSLAKVKLNDIYALKDWINRNVEKRGSGFKIAYVVSRDLEFGIGRMMQSVLEGVPANLRKVFRSMPEAIDWVKAPLEEDLEAEI